MEHFSKSIIKKFTYIRKNNIKIMTSPKTQISFKYSLMTIINTYEYNIVLSRPVWQHNIIKLSINFCVKLLLGLNKRFFFPRVYFLTTQTMNITRVECIGA
jgi:hypothetical protein